MPFDVFGILSGLIGAIFGAGVTSLVYDRQECEKEWLAATVLRNDLKSIERYLKNRNDFTNRINIRYSDSWQRLVAECSFFSKEDVEWIYIFYDEVYNLNYHFKQYEKGICIGERLADSYDGTKKLMLDESNQPTQNYGSLVCRLDKRIAEGNKLKLFKIFKI